MQNYQYMVYTHCITYNQKSYIKETLSGFVIQETSFPVVYAIIDDASTDGESDYLRKWAAEYLVFDDDSFSNRRKMSYGDLYFGKYVNNPNLLFAILLLQENHTQTGRGAKRLEYVAEWRNESKYYAICEGDDYWTDSHKLQKQVEFMESHYEYTLCFTNVVDKYSYGDTCYTKTRSGYDNINLPTDKKSLFYSILLGKCVIQTLTVLYRSENRHNIKPNDKVFLMGDTPLWLDLSQQGPFFFIPEVTGVYVRHEGSASRDTNLIKKLKFQFSMYEMRIYYCDKFNYKIPFSVRRMFFETYFKCLFYGIKELPLDDDISAHINQIQLKVGILAMKYCMVKRLVSLLWMIEHRIWR